MNEKKLDLLKAEQAAEFVVEKQACGVSLLQRKFGIGFSRAIRIIEQPHVITRPHQTPHLR